MPLTEVESAVFNQGVAMSEAQVSDTHDRASYMTTILKSRRYKHTEVERESTAELKRIAEGGKLAKKPTAFRVDKPK